MESHSEEQFYSTDQIMIRFHEIESAINENLQFVDDSIRHESNGGNTDNRQSELPESESRDGQEADLRMHFDENQATYSTAQVMENFDEPGRESVIDLNIEFFEDMRLEHEPADEEDDAGYQSDRNGRSG